MSRKKRFITVICILALAAFSVSAKTLTATSGEYKLDLSWIKTAVNLFVGLIGGGLTLVKTAVDLVHAVNNLAEDPNGIKKVIGRLVIIAIALGGFLFAINFVFGSIGSTGDLSLTLSDPTQANLQNRQQGVQTLKDSTSQNISFYGALTGAIVFNNTDVELTSNERYKLSVFMR